MSDEIVSGLRNALERGETLEKAAQSFLNAGYNAGEVRESVAAMNQGASNIISSSMMSSTSQTSQASLPKVSNPPVQSVSPLPTQAQLEKSLKPKRKHTGLIIALIVILLVLVGALISVVLFGNILLGAMKGFL